MPKIKCYDFGKATPIAKKIYLMVACTYNLKVCVVFSITHVIKQNYAHNKNIPYKEGLGPSMLCN